MTRDHVRSPGSTEYKAGLSGRPKLTTTLLTCKKQPNGGLFIFIQIYCFYISLPILLCCHHQDLPSITSRRTRVDYEPQKTPIRYVEQQPTIAEPTTSEPGPPHRMYRFSPFRLRSDTSLGPRFHPNLQIPSSVRSADFGYPMSSCPTT